MKSINEFNFQSKVTEMADDFYGFKDSEAICNLVIDGIIVQVSITLTAKDEDGFSDYEGIPLVDL